MLRMIYCVQVLFLLICVSVSGQAQLRDIPVATAIEDFELAIAPTLQIKSDGLGDYLNSRDIQSVIQSGGDWVLATNTRTSTRAVYLDFSQPVPFTGPNGGPPIPLPNGVYQARFITKCHVYGTDLLDLIDGQVIPCPMTISFDTTGASYRIQMNPGPGTIVYPETNYVNVTCVGPVPVSPCSEWIIEPTGISGSNKGNVARLTKIVTSKGKTTESEQGDFFFSFLIHLTKQ